MNKKTKTIIWIVVGIVLVGFAGIMISNWLNAADQVSFSELLTYIKDGYNGKKITELYLDGYNWTGYVIENNRIIAKFTAIGPELYSPEGKEYIALSEDCSFTDEKVVLAHELGHSMTGGGYDLALGSLMRVRLEKMAERWAIERLVPLCELKLAIKQGDEAISTLAERFGVTENFMEKVFEHYNSVKSA